MSWSPAIKPAFGKGFQKGHGKGCTPPIEQIPALAEPRALTPALKMLLNFSPRKAENRAPLAVIVCRALDEILIKQDLQAIATEYPAENLHLPIVVHRLDGRLVGKFKAILQPLREAHMPPPVAARHAF